MEVDEASDASGMSGLSEPEEEEMALVVDDPPLPTGLPEASGTTGPVFGERRSHSRSLLLLRWLWCWEAQVGELLCFLVAPW